MDASKLSAGQIDYICRYALTPKLKECEKRKRESAKTDVGIIYANAEIAKIKEIFVMVGYWTDETLAHSDEFRAERESAEREDGGNQ